MLLDPPWVSERWGAAPKATVPKATVESVLDAMGNLHAQRDADGHAKRHQPLALLWAIGEARRRAPRLTAWPEARERIGPLIQEFAGASKENAYLPFLALLGTGIWEMTARPPRAGSSTRRQWLNKKSPPVKAGFTQPVYDLFAESAADAATEATLFLLDTYFDDMTPARTLQVLQAAGLGEIPADPGASGQADAERLLKALGVGSAVVNVEANRTASTQYERLAATILVRRAEAQLVALYRQTLPQDQVKRLRVPGGWTDLYVLGDGDLIEAKSGATHQYVRDALGQLLDYAAHVTHYVGRLTALFPRVPATRDVRLLHAYGIDCLHWTGEGATFHRLEAPTPARDRIKAIWASVATTETRVARGRLQST